MKYKIFISIGEMWSTVAIREIKILQMENESQFVKYTSLESLENNHLYGRDSIIEVIIYRNEIYTPISLKNVNLCMGSHTAILRFAVIRLVVLRYGRNI